MATNKEQQIKEFLNRGVDTVYPTRTALAKRLKSGPPVSIYWGIDPTGADLHIGHLVPLQKLRQAQALGAKVILLVGDFTAQTGDPTDKQAVRQPMSRDEVLANAKHFQKQAAAVLDFGGRNPIETRFNSKWLSKLSFAEVAELAGHFTVQQMLERDMFEDRRKAGKPISLREFLYPLMQGYDSVAMEIDLELGGTDQTFNMLAGRKLEKEYLGKEKFVLTNSLLADAQGVKIGKTAGNAIAITGAPEDLYGQVMTLPDEVITNAFAWCTSVSEEEVADLATLVKKNPRDAKMRLAYAIVREVQGEKAAKQGEEHFVKVFQQKEQPADIPVWEPAARVMNSRDVIKKAFGVSSSEAQRLIAQNAFRVNETTVDTVGEITLRPGDVLQLGKKRFVKVG